MKLFRKSVEVWINARKRQKALSAKENCGESNEKCVLCRADTGVPRSTPVALRERYILGCGQLCRDCYFSLYIKSGEEDLNRPTETEIQRLLAMSRSRTNK